MRRYPIIYLTIMETKDYFICLWGGVLYGRNSAERPWVVYSFRKHERATYWFSDDLATAFVCTLTVRTLTETGPTMLLQRVCRSSFTAAILLVAIVTPALAQ